MKIETVDPCKGQMRVNYNAIMIFQPHNSFGRVNKIKHGNADFSQAQARQFEE